MSMLRQLLRAIGVVSTTRSPVGPKPVAMTSAPSATIQESKELQEILRAVRTNVPVTLVHGRAGTGKTTLIRELTSKGNLRQAIVAPTGVAALNAKGQTIHSFFRIPPRIVNLEDIEPSRKLSQIVNRLDVLIIDEISMVRADVLDVIDKKLRVNRSKDVPFGGLPILMVGDFLQLPPVVPEEEKMILERRGYKNFYALDAKVFAYIKPHLIELETVYRQNEIEFIDLLGRVRLGKDIAEVVSELNRRCHGPHKREAEPVILTARSAAADSYNDQGLRKIPEQAFVYEAHVDGEFRPDRYPALEQLELKKGARVMMVRNDPEKRWVNGSLGTVTRLSNVGAWIKIDGHHSEHEVGRATWENVKYEYSPHSQRVEQRVIGRFSQYPIKHAWAMTIHKSQGLTLQDVRLDLGAGAFTHGQAYVALSRATTLEGLSLSAPIKIEDIKVDHDLIESVRQMQS